MQVQKGSQALNLVVRVGQGGRNLLSLIPLPGTPGPGRICPRGDFGTAVWTGPSEPVRTAVESQQAPRTFQNRPILFLPFLGS